MPIYPLLNFSTPESATLRRIKMRIEKISVCMATYNGSRYLRPQIESILKQLTQRDELIVVDDCSRDSTVSILQSYENSGIVRIVLNKKNMGINRSFERAISMAENDIIFMSDQDDIWPDNRVDIMLNVLRQDEVSLVSGNSCYIDEEEEIIDFHVAPLKEEGSKHPLINLSRILLGTGAYFGCAMAFKKTIVDTILPFPGYIESHDLWIATACIIDGSSRHLGDDILFRRVHGDNASIVKRVYIKKLFSRVVFLVSIIHLIIRMAGDRK